MSYPPNQPGQWSDPNQPGQWSDPNRPGQWSDPGQQGNWWRPPPPPPPPPQKRRPVALWVGLAVVAVVLAGAAIGIAIELSSEDEPSPAAGSSSGSSTSGQPPGTRSTDTKVVTASDNKSQLTVPKQWTEVPEKFRNEAAVIQLGEPRRERYVMVITDEKTDFADFAAFQKAVLDSTTALVDDVQVGDPANLTVGDLPAVRQEINGMVDGIKIVYWFTMVDGKNGYYQVITWTLPSEKDESQPVLEEVVGSFRETAPS